MELCFGYIHDRVKHHILSTAINNRETCEHWIDYEILDSLNEELKEKYISQFEAPEVQWKIIDEKGKLQIICPPRGFQAYRISECNCSKKYSKTIKEITEKYFQK